MTITNATRVVTCALAIAGAAVGLQAQVFQQEEPQAQQPQQPGQFQELGQPEPNVVATVNEEPITEAELESTFTRVLVELRQQMPQDQAIDPAMVQELRERVLDDLIERRLVEQYVIEEGPDVEQEEVQATVGEVREQVQAQGADFTDFLAAQGLTEEGFEKRVEGALAWQKHLQEVVTEPKLEEYFEENKEQFAADDFQQARIEVAQAYTASVWRDIVEQMRPEAEIEKMEAPGEARPPVEQPFPGGIPPQQQ